MQKLLFVVLFLLLSCSQSEKVSGGKIVLRNDVLDKEYNSFVVDQIRTENGAEGFSKTLKPEDETSLPFKNIRSFRVRRRYVDHTKIYHVSCPKGFDEKVIIKLIDIHTNRMGGGCTLTRKGTEQIGGLTIWEDK